jgi:flagellar motility protein MotE (MotC chaperone)
MKRRRFGARGSLGLIALLLASAGALRMGQGFGAAMARQAEPMAESTAGPPAECPQPPAALLAAIQARDEQVTTRETALEDRLVALAMAEDAITARMAELEQAESSLRETLAIADGAAEKDLVRLTAVYEAMKPAEAAQLFEAMAPEFAAGFLGRMRPDAAAAIISGMQAENAYAISVLIAGRNALAPKN